MPTHRHSSKEYTESYYEKQLKKHNAKKAKEGNERPVRDTVLYPSQKTLESITKGV